MEPNIYSKPILFYDGGCPLCRKEIDHYRRLDQDGRVDWVDITGQPERLERFEIEPHEAMRRIHAVSQEGEVIVGVRAFVLTWERLPYYRYLASLVSKLGLIRPLNALYVRFADWRFKKRCAEAACSVEFPDQSR